jgi:hypothetical protein
MIVPDALATEEDGARLAFAGELAERAARIGVEVHRPGCVRVDPASGSHALAFQLVGETRRAKAVGRISEEAPTLVVLYPTSVSRSSPQLSARIAEIEASRIVLSLMLVQEEPQPSRGSRRVMPQNAPGISRRFRA